MLPLRRILLLQPLLLLAVLLVLPSLLFLLPLWLRLRLWLRLSVRLPLLLWLCSKRVLHPCILEHQLKLSSVEHVVLDSLSDWLRLFLRLLPLFLLFLHLPSSPLLTPATRCWPLLSPHQQQLPQPL